MKRKWKWYSFEDFSSTELYAILRLRQQVFIVEQQCAYLDCDDIDKVALHLVGWYEIDKIQPMPCAYLRTIPPLKPKELPSIGRLLTHPDWRRRGVGREAILKGLQHLSTLYPTSPVRISAQQYLTRFYESLGFNISSDVYDEDGIPHIEMIHYLKT